MRYRDVGSFFVPELEDEVVGLIDEVMRREMGARVVLGGLCAGGFWSFHGAARDTRVAAALLMNPRLLVWDAEVVARRDARKLTRLRNLAWWRRIVRGQVRLSRMREIARAAVRRAWRGVARLPSALRASRGDTVNPVEELLARLRDHGTRVLMAFSDDEPLHDELEEEGFLARLDEWPNLEVQTLPGRDHTFRPIVVQRAVHALLDHELTRVLDGVPATHRDPGTQAEP